MIVYLQPISDLDLNPAQLKTLRTKLKHLIRQGRYVEFESSSRKLLAKHGLIRSKGEAPNAPDNSHRGCGRSATGEGLTDSPPLPKGHGYISLGTMVDKHGNVSEIPSSRSALMYCGLCCKEGDHWTRNCPDWHRPEPEPASAVQTKRKESKSVVQTQRKKKSKSAAGTNNSSYETKE
ncbi:uncharacterized protein LOC121050899 [Rosa chinensis]|uniref:uncharacterized protein LOC121050893 n=1 Tax=Rosa chinensis TaxID=74649 RepID=UPI001AD8BD0C|nr:uncharacterized protein LOC121050893 [Rosa chinensis]XP_040368253.1 uncharacterized protein LOC121050894 [Rosa chinensis]XP_040368254.1 uncharacterized protein LOC121050895 [Rosa chinensis]XP_040368257.1 uncharacterized protein LOC121050898 [Rosa chinensis]XP_040368258.1 uncharacterized protein LOC121050899 [Rosa chinensis]